MNGVISGGAQLGAASVFQEAQVCLTGLESARTLQRPMSHTQVTRLTALRSVSVHHVNQEKSVPTLWV